MCFKTNKEDLEKVRQLEETRKDLTKKKLNNRYFCHDLENFFESSIDQQKSQLKKKEKKEKSNNNRKGSFTECYHQKSLN